MNPTASNYLVQYVKMNFDDLIDISFCTTTSVRNKGRSTATRPAASWHDRELFASASPGDRQPVIGGDCQ